MKKTKKSQRLSLRYLYVTGLFAWLLIALVWLTNPGFAESITQSYQTVSTVQQGTIVQLVPNDSSEVEAVTNNNMQKTLGVVINAADTNIDLSNNSPGQHVYVANNGTYPVLVSNQNGYIGVGDYITVSNIDGVGMQADSSEPEVIGQASSVFNAQSPVYGTESITNNSGKKQTVQLGLVNVTIAIAKNPLQKPQYSLVPAFLESITKYVAGKTVTAWRVYLATAILILVLIITVSMFYSAVRNSIISVGRNPLSAKIITRGFVEIVLLALLILVSGIFGVYLLLRL